MDKEYKQIEPKRTFAKEPTVAYTSHKGENCHDMSEMCSDKKSAIPREELMNRLRLRIKALYK